MYVCKKCLSTYHEADESFRCMRLECDGSLCKTEEYLHGAVVELLKNGYDVCSASVESKFDAEIFTSILFYDNCPDVKDNEIVKYRNFYISRDREIIDESRIHEYDFLYEYKEIYIEKENLNGIDKDISILLSIMKLYEWVKNLPAISFRKDLN